MHPHTIPHLSNPLHALTGNGGLIAMNYKNQIPYRALRSSVFASLFFVFVLLGLLGGYLDLERSEGYCCSM